MKKITQRFLAIWDLSEAIKIKMLVKIQNGNYTERWDREREGERD